MIIYGVFTIEIMVSIIIISSTSSYFKIYSRNNVCIYCIYKDLGEIFSGKVKGIFK